MEIKTQYVYTIRDIVSGKKFEAHVTRLHFYSTEQLGETGELKNLVSRQGVETEVENIGSVKWDAMQNKYVVETKWRGLSDVETSYKPFEELFKQIPRLILSYLEVFAEKQKKE